MEVARWITTLDLTGEPGDKNNAVYGNTDDFLLSLIVAKKLRVASFEAALATLVLHPLGQQHTRGSRSLVGAQAADEARYHLTVHNPDNSFGMASLAAAGLAPKPAPFTIPPARTLQQVAESLARALPARRAATSARNRP